MYVIEPVQVINQEDRLAAKKKQKKSLSITPSDCCQSLSLKQIPISLQNFKWDHSNETLRIYGGGCHFRSIGV